MSRHYVCEQPDHQRKRLGYKTEKFDGLHYRNREFKEKRHIWPQDFLPIMLVCKDIYGNEGTKRQHQSHCNISCHIRSSREERNQSQKVTQEYEEECREQKKRRLNVSGVLRIRVRRMKMRLILTTPCMD